MSKTSAIVLAERLRAIGSHINDQVAANTPTGTTLLEAAERLEAFDDLLASLDEAIGLIRFYHGPEGWQEYQESPEMKRLKAAKAKGATP